MDTPIEFTTTEIATYFRVRVPGLAQHGTEWRGRCPVHGGKNDNFAVNPKTGQAYCHSKCQLGWDIISFEQALTGVDFIPARDRVFGVVGKVVGGNAVPRGSHPVFAGISEYAWEFLDQRIRAVKKDKRFLLTQKFYYTHADGRLLYVKVRFAAENGSKTFLKFAPTARGGWTTPKKAGIPSTLYHLHLLASATEIHFANGEKAADCAFQKLGLTTTCLPDGEAKWDPSFTSLLKGKRVVVYLDNDDKGRRHGHVVAENLLGHAAEIRLVRLPNLPPKGDLFDWIEAGGTLEALRGLIESTPVTREPFTAEACDSDHDTLSTIIADGESARGKSEGPAAASLFVVDESGVWWAEHPDMDPVRVCSRLDVIAYTRNDRGEAWGRLLRWKDPEGGEHSWPMPMSVLAGDGNDYRGRLLDGGLMIEPGRKTNAALARYLQSAKPNRWARCVNRIGWHEAGFVLPDVVVAPESTELVVYQLPHEAEHHFNVSGTLDEWKANVSAKCIGNSRLVLAVSIAFAGPLVSLVNGESGGIHLVGGSSTGKTTALIVGGSVCGGGGKNGCVQSWRSTVNGLSLWQRVTTIWRFSWTSSVKWTPAKLLKLLTSSQTARASSA